MKKIYKIKRFSFGKKVLKGVAVGAGIGGSLFAMSDKEDRGIASISGAILGGTLGGLISAGSHLISKLKEREQKSLEKIAEDMEKVKVAWEKRMFPQKEDEIEYKKITEIGGMPKEYYQAVEIKKKMAQKEYIKGLSEDQYLIFGIVPLDTFENWLERDQKENPAPMIFVGCGERCHAFCHINGSWIERNMRESFKIKDLKKYITFLYEHEIDILNGLKKERGLDTLTKAIIDSYKYQLSVIKSMPLG